MRKHALVATTATLLGAAMQVALGTPANAHNRAHIILPSGECIIVGSEKSVELPDGSLLDLRPETGDRGRVRDGLCSRRGPVLPPEGLLPEAGWTRGGAVCR